MVLSDTLLAMRQAFRHFLGTMAFLFVAAVSIFIWTSSCSRSSRQPARSCAEDPTVCATECEGGLAASCTRVADMYSDGKGGMPKDPVKALSYYEKGCNGKDR